MPKPVFHAPQFQMSDEALAFSVVAAAAFFLIAITAVLSVAVPWK